MKYFQLVKALCLGCLLLAGTSTSADTLFTATLDGLQEVSPNNSPATGFGTVVLNDAMDQITVNLLWSGLTTAATAAHIHGPALPGVNAAVIFPLSGVPAATAGTIPQQIFSINAAQITELQEGLYYMNVHTSVFPGGEIRGQLVPEPVILSLLAVGSLVFLRKRRV